MSHQVSGVSSQRARRQDLQTGDAAGFTNSFSPSVSVRTSASSTLFTRCTSADSRTDKAVTALQRLRQLMQGLRYISDNQWHCLEPLLAELHAAQKDIAYVMNHCSQAEGVGGFCQESLNFVKRCAAAMTGEKPALGKLSIELAEKLCIGLSALAPVKSPPPFRGAAVRQASDALTVISARIFDDIATLKSGAAAMTLGQKLSIHNWIRRSASAKLLHLDCDALSSLLRFSQQVFEQFVQLARHPVSRLDARDLAKLTSQVEAMLRLRLAGPQWMQDHEDELQKGDELQRRADLLDLLSWLVSADAFEIWESQKGNPSALFQLFKQLLAMDKLEPGDEHMVRTWVHMVRGMIVVFSKVRSEEAVVSCANLLRTMRSKGVTNRWSKEDGKLFHEAGSLLLNVITHGEQPWGLTATANLLSFLKAWHRKPRKVDSDPSVSGGAPAERQLSNDEIALKKAATVLIATVSHERLQLLDDKRTAGGLLFALDYLEQYGLLDAPTVRSRMPQLVAAIARDKSGWSLEDAKRGVRIILSHLRAGLLDWDAVQPSLKAMLGDPSHGDSWDAAALNSILEREAEPEVADAMGLGQHLKEIPQAKPAMRPVIGMGPKLGEGKKRQASTYLGPVSNSTAQRLRSEQKQGGAVDGGFIKPTKTAKGMPVPLTRNMLAVLADPDREANSPRTSAEAKARQAPAPMPRRKPQVAAKARHARGGDKAREDDEALEKAIEQARQIRDISKTWDKLFDPDTREEQVLEILSGNIAPAIRDYAEKQDTHLFTVGLRPGWSRVLDLLLSQPKWRPLLTRPDTRGLTPLAHAIQSGNPVTVSHLLRHADLNKHPLRGAPASFDPVLAAIDGIGKQGQAGNDALEVLRLLLEVPSLRKLAAESHLAHACEKDLEQVVAMLLALPGMAAKATRATMTRTSGLCPERPAVIALENGALNSLRRLLEVKAVREEEAKENGIFNTVPHGETSTRFSEECHFLLGYPEFRINLSEPENFLSWNTLRAAMCRLSIQESQALLAASPELVAAAVLPRNTLSYLGVTLDVLVEAIVYGQTRLAYALLDKAPVRQKVESNADYAWLLLQSAAKCDGALVFHLMTNFPDAMERAMASEREYRDDDGKLISLAREELQRLVHEVMERSASRTHIAPAQAGRGESDA